MATNYQLQKGETPEQYQKRNNTTTITPSTPTNDQNSAIFNALQAKLTEQAGAISSSYSNIEKRINSAISGVQTGANAENQRIQSQFGREFGYAQDRARSEVQNFSESRSGFATQMSAFRNLVETTDKYMADLSQRKEELILQNNAAAAGKIADLELKSLEYVQKARQDTFDNIFKSASLELSRMGEDRAGRELLATTEFNRTRLELDREELDNNKQNVMASLASQYGVTIEAGEDLADIVKKVAPMASAKQKKELELLQAQINKQYEDSNQAITDINLEHEIVAAMTEGTVGEDGKLHVMTATEAADFALQGLRNLDVKNVGSYYNKAYDIAKKQERALKIESMKNKEAAYQAPGLFEALFDYAKQNNFSLIQTPYAGVRDTMKDLFGNDL